MDGRALQINIMVLFLALLVLLLFPYPVWHDLDVAGVLETEPDTEDPNSAFLHDHAYLFFLVEGERKPLSDAYIERDPYAHFHSDDGILHIEGERSNLSRTLNTLEINVNASCITFGLDDERYCTDDDTEIRVNINGETLPLDEALGHDIQQDDNIVLFHGDRDAEIPDRYTDRTLPDAYRPGPAYDQV